MSWNPSCSSSQQPEPPAVPAPGHIDINHVHDDHHIDGHGDHNHNDHRIFYLRLLGVHLLLFVCVRHVCLRVDIIKHIVLSDCFQVIILNRNGWSPCSLSRIRCLPSALRAPSEPRCCGDWRSGSSGGSPPCRWPGIIFAKNILQISYKYFTLHSIRKARWCRLHTCPVSNFLWQITVSLTNQSSGSMLGPGVA